LSVFQKKLELYYNAEHTSVRLHYERRSQQYNSSPVKRTHIISIPIQIKAFASVFLDSPHLVSGYYGTIVRKFENRIFGTDHQYSPYYVSSLCYYRIEQFFRNGFLDSKLKKARFQIMMLVRYLAIGELIPQLNSHQIDKLCEQFKAQLLDDDKALDLFFTASSIFEQSGLDSKPQYKSESDTLQLKRAYNRWLAQKRS
jgi:hypothetical protein